MGIDIDKFEKKCEECDRKDECSISEHERKTVVHNYKLMNAVEAMLKDGCSVIEVVGSLEAAKSHVLACAEADANRMSSRTITDMLRSLL